VVSRSNFLLIVVEDCARSIGGMFCMQFVYSIPVLLATPFRVAERLNFSFNNLSSEDKYV
jgi:hypothetical protein